MSSSIDVVLRLVIQSDTSQATQSLSSISVQASQLGTSVQTGASVASQAMENFGRQVDGAHKKFEEFASKIAAAGLALAGMGAAIAAPAAEAIKVSADFERGMMKLQAVADKGLGSVAHELAAATEFTNNQVVEALAVLREHGQTSEQALANIKPTLDLATTGAVGLAQAADIVTSIMDPFKFFEGALKRR